MPGSEPLDWQFTDCRQGSPMPCPSFLTVRSLSGGVEEFRTVPTVPLCSVHSISVSDDFVNNN